MKVLLLGLFTSLLAASCTQNLEQVADTNRQVRMDKANASLPLTSGAADGLGNFIARKYDEPSPAPTGEATGPKVQP